MMKFQLGDQVRKTKGSEWHGTVVGTYSTALTPEGYCVESATERGSVQIYPAAALERWQSRDGFEEWFAAEVEAVERGMQHGAISAMRFSKEVLRIGWNASREALAEKE